ncbi:MAG: DUF2961 domain-containing protein, partial [Cytophagaceae bacterium]|nr:DUF2961 domain-containing protein [Cytophagaceae bacterium]
TMPAGVETRWVSFENPTGEEGNGGRENKGAKGHPADRIPAGTSKEIFSVKGAGIIKRIWLTIDDRSPEMFRSLKIEMFWDDANQPAVSAPLGDFFGVGLGRRVPFECELFSDPEGKSFNCYIPMPFRTAAKIVITNESEKDLGLLFYDINYLKTKAHAEDVLYFHCHWRRERNTTLQKDFEILPKVTGRGRFLGTNIGVIVDTIYKNTWWGEGEVKMYIDGDTTLPTLVGTGTEDYVGTGWGQGAYHQRFQGSPISDSKNKQWTFYRYHIPDPVYFQSECKVTIQQMGGAPKAEVLELYKKGVPLIPVTVAGIKLMEMPDPPKITDENFPDSWTNFYRQDDYSATSYFYLNKKKNNLPPLAPVSERVAGLLKK